MHETHKDITNVRDLQPQSGGSHQLVRRC
jgi:hypothetical protein